MRKYYCMNPIAQVGLDNFSKNYIKTDEITEAEGILVRSASMHDMELPDGLLAVARAGAGVNNIPLEKCAEKGIVVFNTPGANANGVKELVIAGMLLASRDVVSGINWVKENQEDENIAKDAEKEKKKFAGTEVMGKRLGIIALGAIVFYNNIIMRVLGDVMWRWGQDNPFFRAVYLMLDALPQIVVCVALIVCGMWLVRGPKNKKGKQPSEEEAEDFHAYTATPRAEDTETEDTEAADTDTQFAMPELSALLGEPVTGAEQDENPAEDDDDRAE